MGHDARLLSLLVCCLLVTASGDQCKQHEALARTPPLECITLRDVCIDQQHFVSCKSLRVLALFATDVPLDPCS